MSIESLRLWSGKDITEFPNYEKEELDVPYFINEPDRRLQAREWRKHNEQARIGAAIGAERRKARQEMSAEQYRINSKRGGVVIVALMTALLFLVGAVEKGLIL